MANTDSKTTEKKAEIKKEDETKKEEPAPPLTPLAEIKTNITLLERAVTTLEPRFTHRVLRGLTALRKKIDDAVLRQSIEEVYPKSRSLAL
jgi:26S proteasome regulatory subunit N3